MADILPFLEMMENRWMRAWVARDVRTLKAVTSRHFRLVIASKPPVILDSASWLQAAGSRLVCSSYRLGDSLYARQDGTTALFATQLELEMTVEGRDWSGQFWVTDLWRRSRIRRQWRMTERLMSRPEEAPQVSADIRALQLWR